MLENGRVLLPKRIFSDEDQEQLDSLENRMEDLMKSVREAKYEPSQEIKAQVVMCHNSILKLRDRREVAINHLRAWN